MQAKPPHPPQGLHATTPEFLAAHCESPALGVGQTKRSRTKMLPEDAILLPEIVDAIFLVASHPASQGQHEEMQSVGHGRRLHGSDTAVTHVVSGIHSPRPFSRTIRVQQSLVLLSACSATMPARLLTLTSQQAARKSSLGNGDTRCLCHADEIPKLALILTWAKSGSKLIDSRTMAFT